MSATQKVACSLCGTRLKINPAATQTLKCPRCDTVIFEPVIKPASAAKQPRKRVPALENLELPLDAEPSDPDAAGEDDWLPDLPRELSGKGNHRPAATTRQGSSAKTTSDDDPAADQEDAAFSFLSEPSSGRPAAATKDTTGVGHNDSGETRGRADSFADADTTGEDSGDDDDIIDLAAPLGRDDAEPTSADDAEFAEHLGTAFAEDEYRVEHLPEYRLTSPRKKKKRKKAEPPPEEDDEESSPAEDTRRLSTTPTTVWGMLEGCVSPIFWADCRPHWITMILPVSLLSALFGFLYSLVRTTDVALFLLQVMGAVSLLASFLTFAYPGSCWWRVVCGTAQAEDELSEWPEPGEMGAWTVDMLFVGYLVAMSLMISGGAAKVVQWTVPATIVGEDYWQIFSTTEEARPLQFAWNFIEPAQAAVRVEVVSRRPQLTPQAGWRITLMTFVVVFPLVVISCLDSSSPMYVPWSPRTWRSWAKQPFAWLAVLGLSGVTIPLLAGLLVFGINTAPFLSFTVAGSLGMFVLIAYARLLGRLSWLIDQTVP